MRSHCKFSSPSLTAISFFLLVIVCFPLHSFFIAFRLVSLLCFHTLVPLNGALMASQSPSLVSLFLCAIAAASPLSLCLFAAHSCPSSCLLILRCVPDARSMQPVTFFLLFHALSVTTFSCPQYSLVEKRPVLKEQRGNNRRVLQKWQQGISAQLQSPFWPI